jgi:hypothetical protein
MRFARGDMRGTTSFHTKTTTNLRSGTAEPCSGKNVQKSTFAGISGQFDFRLLQQYRHFSDMPSADRDIGMPPRSFAQ